MNIIEQLEQEEITRWANHFPISRPAIRHRQP